MNLADALVGRFLPVNVIAAIAMRRCCDDAKCPDANPLPVPEMVWHLSRFWRTRAICGNTYPFALAVMKKRPESPVSFDGTGVKTVGEFRTQISEGVGKIRFDDRTDSLASLTTALVIGTSVPKIMEYNKAVKSGSKEVPVLLYHGLSEVPGVDRVREEDGKTAYLLSVFHEQPETGFPFRAFCAPLMPPFASRRATHDALKEMLFSGDDLDRVRPVRFHGDMVEHRRGHIRPESNDDHGPVFVKA